VTSQQTSQKEKPTKLYVTLAGIPLFFTLEWPFRPSTGGADFFVLHGDIRVAGADGLHAPVAVNLTQTLRDVLPSLDPKDTEAPVIDALRKEVDNKQIEFLKSGKLLPLAFSSRFYDRKRQKWAFQHASKDELSHFLRRKIYWEQKLKATPGKTSLFDPVDLLYFDVSADLVREVARQLASEGLIRVEGEYAEATDALLAQGLMIESQMKRALEDLERKHAFERG
jgi:hypothetical protein